ncbi:Ig-like domain-containing protein [Vibrio jasicida]|uniref:Ig-like domain-containing protein n=1 Tax=Vibrio jasicida TaxID=766224 RepID=UPI00406798EB
MKNRTLISILFCLFSLTGCDFNKDPVLSLSYEESTVSHELVIHAESQSLPKGDKLYLRAQLLDSENNGWLTETDTVIWNSSNEKVATINSSGLLLAKSQGATTITASVNKDGLAFSVSLEITVSEAMLSKLTLVLANEGSTPKGLTLPFQVMGEYSDGNRIDLTDSSELQCHIADSTVAQLTLGNPANLIQGMSVGNTVLNCTYGDTALEAGKKISISKAIPVELSLSLEHSELPVGSSSQILAFAKFSDSSTQEITNSPELHLDIRDRSLASIIQEQDQTQLFATSTGTAILTAKIKNTELSDEVSVVITPAEFSTLNVTLEKDEIPLGLSTHVQALAELTDQSTINVTRDPRVIWSVLPVTIARIETKENKLTIKALKPGQATLIASLNDGQIRSQVPFSVSEPVVTKLSLSPNVDSLPKGLSHSFQAWATYSDGSIAEVTSASEFQWSVDNTDIATFELSPHKGMITGIQVGETNITGTLSDSWRSTATLTVSDAIVTEINFDETELFLPVGLEHPLKVNALLSDGSIIDISNSPEISFIVSNNEFADFDDQERNVVVGKNMGSTTITALAKFNSLEHQNHMTLFVMPPVIKRLSLESTFTEITAGVPLVLQAIATMTDGSEVNVTNSSTLDWSVEPVGSAELTQSTEGITLTGIEKGEIKVSVTAESFPSTVTTQKTFTVVPKDYTITLVEEAISPLSRSVFEGYDIDDIKIRHNGLTNFDLLNTTPRYLNNPLVRVNQQHFRITGVISPFKAVNFELPEWFDEPIASAYFVDEQPLFKAHIRAYADVRQNDDKYAQPTTENVYQYEKELRGFKQLMNNYDYNHQFIGFIQSYMNSRTRMIRHEDHWCEVETLLTSTRSIESSSDHFAKFKGNDTSPHTLKHVSLIANKPSATYMMLTREANGVATVGDGWLSVRDFRLFSEGATSPKTTYLHEKMHNHGFGHKGGMTYGYPAETGKFVNQSWTQFYEDGAVEASTPTLASQYELKDLGKQFKLEISFLDKSTSAPSNRHIDKFILLTTSLAKLERSYLIDHNNNAIEIYPELDSGYEHTYVFNNIEPIQPQSISEANSEPVASKLIFVFDKPEQANTNNIPTSIIFIGGNREDTKQQTNLVINYSGSGGFVSKDGQFVYLTKQWNKNDNNVFTNEVNTLSPIEAEQFCKEKGLNLGTLKPFRSRDMMDFQTKYQKYGTQVGLSYETGTPMAISVPTTYRPNTITEVEKGAVIVCNEQ